MVAITPEFRQALKEHLKSIPQLSEKDREAMNAQIDAGEGSLMSLMGVQPAFVEFAYSQATQAYDLRDLKKAYALFHFLHQLNSSDPRFMMGIAATAQLKGDFTDAQYWYLLADHFMDTDPMIACYLSECFAKTDQPLQQKLFLEIAQERCNKSAQYDTLKARIGLMLKEMEGV